MLSKVNRLTRREVEEIKKAQKVIIQGRYFGLIRQTGPGISKFGIVVSNNISKKAVERNRIRRLLYRFIKKDLLGEESKFLFLAKKSSLGMTVKQAEEEILFFKSRLK